MREKLNTKQSILQLVLVIFFVGGALITASWLKRSNEAKTDITIAEEERIASVSPMVIRPANIPIAFKSTGNTASRSLVNIVPQVSGKIVSVNPDFYAGGMFKAKVPLFKIEQTDYLNEIERLKASIAQSKTNIALQKAAAETALQEWETLYPGEKPNDLVLKKPQLQEAEAALKSAKAQLSTARTNLSRTTFSLPYDGRVQSSDVEIGQFVVAGQSYGTVYPSNSIEFVVPLTDKQLNWLQKTSNPEITITLDSREDQRYSAKIKRISNSKNLQTRLIDVYLDTTQPLPPGQFGTAYFVAGQFKQAYEIPRNSLQESDDGTAFVWQVIESRLQKAYPEILLQNGEKTIVQFSDKQEFEIVPQQLPEAVEGMQVKLN